MSVPQFVIKHRKSGLTLAEYAQCEYIPIEPGSETRIDYSKCELYAFQDDRGRPCFWFVYCNEIDIVVLDPEEFVWLRIDRVEFK